MTGPLSSQLGRFQFLRGKSLIYIEAVRAWVTPAAAAGAFAKYAGLPSRWSIAVAIIVPVAVEIFGFLLGRFLYEGGGVETEYRLAMERDPYKLEQLRLQEETLAILRERLPAGQNADVT